MDARITSSKPLRKTLTRRVRLQSTRRRGKSTSLFVHTRNESITRDWTSSWTTTSLLQVGVVWRLHGEGPSVWWRHCSAVEL